MNETLGEFLEGLSTEREAAFVAFCDNEHTDHKSDEAAELIDSFEDSYRGEFSTEAEFAEDLMTDTMQIPKELASYIDYGKFWNDLQMGGDYWSVKSPDGEFFIFSSY